MSAPSILALDAAQAQSTPTTLSVPSATTTASPWRLPCPACARSIPVLDDLTLATHNGPRVQGEDLRYTRPECVASGIDVSDDIVPCVPWIALARTIVARLRFSPAAHAFEQLAAQCIASLPACVADADPNNTAIDLWREGFVTTLRALPYAPMLPRSIDITSALRDRRAADHVALCAVRERYSAVAPPILIIALDALLTELSNELLGAHRWFVTPHAIDRYGERFAPYAFQDEIRATLHRIAGTATHSEQAQRGVNWSSPDHPRVQLTVADNTVVTVMDTGQWRRVDSGRAEGRASNRAERRGRGRE